VVGTTSDAATQHVRYKVHQLKLLLSLQTHDRLVCERIVERQGEEVACILLREVSSIASLIAIPRDPGWFGFSASNFLPVSVFSLGDSRTSAPYVSIKIFLPGFCWALTLTM